METVKHGICVNYRFSLRDDMLCRGSYLDEVAVGVIEPNHGLAPAVSHESVDVLRLRIQLLQLLNEGIDVGLFEIQFAGIVFADDVSTQEFLPVLLFLKALRN